MRRLIDAVTKDQKRSWKDVTRKTHATDANDVLEALIAECGSEKALEAVRNQCLQGNYRQIIEILYEEAVARRARRCAALKKKKTGSIP